MAPEVGHSSTVIEPPQDPDAHNSPVTKESKHVHFLRYSPSVLLLHPVLDGAFDLTTTSLSSVPEVDVVNGGLEAEKEPAEAPARQSPKTAFKTAEDSD